MKKILKISAVLLLAVGLVFSLTGCDDNGGDTTVTFLSLTANGSATSTTTELTLTFNSAISGLSATNIMLGGEAATGVTIGTMTGTPPVYIVPLSNVTQGGNLTVTVSIPGYNIIGATQTVSIYFHVELLEQFFALTFNDNNLGSTIVANNTTFDMLLFRGEALTTGNIIAGARAGVPSTRINLSSETNYNVGGWVVLRAVRASAFESDGINARVDHSVMATFRQGTETTVSIVSTTDGDFQFIVHNMSNQFALQLRENSPTGRVVAFLTRGEQNRVINTPNAEQILLHPVWIGFSNQTMSIVEFAPTEPFSAQQAIPSQPGVGLTHNMHFPWQEASPIVFPVRAPAAVIRVQNNFNLAATFRTSSSPHHAIDAPATILGTGIIPGDWRTFSMETAGTAGLNLNIFLQGGNLEVPIRFAGETTLPVIEAGYYYLVTFRHLTGQPITDPNSFEAVISRTGPIDTSDVIQAP